MTDKKKKDYPKVPRNEDHKITLFQKDIKDPYIDLTLDNKKFVTDQKEFFEREIRKLPEWEKYRSRLKAISKFDREYLPIKIKKVYFFLAIRGDEFHKVLYKAEKLEDDEKPIFNINTFPNYEHLIPMLWSVDPEAKYLVFCYRKDEDRCNGEIVFREVDEVTKKPTILENRLLVGSDVAWYENGFFYGSKLKPNNYPCIFYHKTTSSKAKDDIIFQLERSDLILTPLVSDDKKFLYIFVTSPKEYGNLLYFSLLKRDMRKVLQVVGKWGRIYKYVANVKNLAYFLTSKKSSRNHIVQIDMYNRKPKCHCEWTEIVPKHSTDLMWNATYADKHLIIHFMRDGSPYLRFFSLKDRKFLKYKIAQSTGMIKLQRSYDPTDPDFFYEFESYHIPPRVYRANINELKQEKAPKLIFESRLKDFSPSDFFVYFKTFVSNDGNYNVPLYLVGKKSTDLRPRPCILGVNGGFGECFWPRFDPYIFAFFEIFSGTRACVFIRGGGERGRKWWNSGRRKKKIKGIEDLVGACRFLQDRGYTTKNSLALEGEFNGGLVIAASILKNADLCAVAILVNPLIDMINFVNVCARDKLIYEYGDPAKNQTNFERIMKYSPYHNISGIVSANELVPATLVVGAMKNALAPLWHSCKFVAALQHQATQSTIQEDPIFFYTTPEVDFIHGQWNSAEMINHYADKYVMIKNYSATDIDYKNKKKK